uniref:RNA-directed DNA polymerase n=1 Tax=Trichuris muris TaxID=70415 RepID=A0A5S6QNU4_TRIMR
MLSGIKGAVAYLDDVIVVGRTEQEHRNNLESVFKRIGEFGFCVRPEKCILFLPSIKYLGFVVERNGRRPDPDKISTIKRMPAPSDQASLRSFLGLVNYYGTFVHELSKIRSPLDALLRKGARWKWSAECQQAFDHVKEILESDLLLTHYDPNKKIIVAADASNHGIGAVIMHRFADGTEKAICHASRTLTNAEQKYSQIEKEALGLVFAVKKFHRMIPLGLVFAVKKFHRMIHGRRFTLLTDHKPLLAVFGSKKGVPMYTANRLERWATTLLGYDFTIEYRSTEKFGQADALSRLVDKHAVAEEDVVIAAINAKDDIRRCLSDSIHSFPVTSELISRATAEESVLTELMKCIVDNWAKPPESKHLQPFFNRRNALSVLEGCIMMTDRMVIPKRLQPAILRQLPHGHPGIVRMKAIARSYIYWPGLDMEIETVVRSCDKCAAVAKAPVKTELASWPLPEKPWSRIHVDYAGPMDGQYFLVVVDA